jgi:hypothetical protein
MLFFSEGNGLRNAPEMGNNAMNAPRCWQLCDYACSHAGTSANTLAALQREWGNSSAFEKADKSAAFS